MSPGKISTLTFRIEPPLTYREVNVQTRPPNNFPAAAKSHLKGQLRGPQTAPSNR
jgi:hypothetical protein